MNRIKLLIVIIIALVVVVTVAVAVYGVISRNGGQQTNLNTTNTTNDNTNQVNTNTVSNTNGTLVNVNVDAVNTNTAVGDGNTEEDDRASLLRLARIVVERYGSFSNRNNFENITSLEPFMTEAFRTASAQYINENQTSGIAEDYYGITTTAVSLTLSGYTANESATVRVGTRRVESQAHTDPEVFTQYATVDFQALEGTWKVSNIVWE